MIVFLLGNRDDQPRLVYWKSNSVVTFARRSFKERGRKLEGAYMRRGRESALSFRRLQELNDGALFLAGDVGPQQHVMNDHVPLRVAIHCGRSNIMAAQTIVRPKLFPRKTHVGITRGRAARFARRFPVFFRVRKQIHARADEE